MNMSHKDKWLAMKNEIDSRGANGSDIVELIQDYYSVFEDRMLVWLAGLYDPDVGGFYYSNSGRDNEFVNYNGVEYPLLPDIESTNQATNFLIGNKVFKNGADFPEQMVKKMAQFVCERQDPETGFFYHPQWPKALTDSYPSRRGRDHAWSIQMSQKFNFKLPYPTASERLEQKTENKEGLQKLPEYLTSEDRFIAYLKSKDWDNQPYLYGNEIAAQAWMLESAGLADTVVNFFNSIMNPETGFWGIKQSGYDAINAYLKISSIYRVTNRPIPNSDKAARTVVECAASDEQVGATCLQYNAWFSLCNILQNLREFGGNDGCAKAKDIALDCLKNSSAAITSTKEKALIFKREDGSFSMGPKYSCATSQGMPVAINHSEEGDVNATVICSSGTAEWMLEAFDLKDYIVPIFSENSKEIFLSALKSAEK